MKKSDQTTDVAIGGAPNKEVIIGEWMEMAGNIRPEGAPDAEPQGRPCITLEAAIDKTRAHLVCDPKRQTERAQAAICGLVDKGLLCFEGGFLWCK